MKMDARLKGLVPEEDEVKAVEKIIKKLVRLTGDKIIDENTFMTYVLICEKFIKEE